MVPVEEIERNEFNLNLPRYIDSQTPEDLQDIEGHLKGGIPAADVDALQRYWTVCPTLRQVLFKANRPGYLDLAVDKAAIKTTIYEHPEFASFIARMNAVFAEWRQKSAGTLRRLEAGCHPKEVIAALADDVLAHYAGKPLIDPYDVYQHLMDYWAETMQDDCYLIAADGWKAETSRIIEKDKKGKEKDKGWACDLLPKALIVARYFSKEQEAIDQLAVELESVTAQMTELEEEHSGEEGAFSEFDKVNKGNVIARLKEIKGLFGQDDAETKTEAEILSEWLLLNGEQSGLKKRLKDAEAALDAQAYTHYPRLTEAEVKTLVVDDKWLAALDAAIQGEMDRISQALTQRVKELDERYETPLPQMVGRVADLEAKVNRHLAKMGFSFSGEWRVESGELKVESGKWRVENE
jgi:type I restriction enzyme M protein